VLLGPCAAASLRDGWDHGGRALTVRILFLTALITVIAGLTSSPAAAQSGRSFYIDYTRGSNANNGTKSAPWKSHPYMQTSSPCSDTGSAPTYSHQAGDRFIFKGGVSWPAACFQMQIQAGGNSSALDYYGVDQSWFAGGSWTRPTFDLSYAVPSGNVVIYGSAGSGYEIFDNLEIVHQGITVDGKYGTQQAYQLNSGATGVVIKNGYIHDWATSGTITRGSLQYSAGSIFGAITLDDTEIEDSGGYHFVNGVKTAVRFGGACQNCAEVKNSKIHDTMAGCFTVYHCHDSEFYNITANVQAYDSNIHTQVIEDDQPSGTSSGGMAVYNNVIHDNTPVGVTIYVPYNSYVYNNVMWNNGNKDILLTYPGNDSTSKVGYVVNNTVDCSNGTPCVGMDNKTAGLGTLNLQNNHWITNGSPTCFNASGCLNIGSIANSGNITMSTSTASSQGYTNVNWYMPTSSSGGTVGRALSLASLCSGGLGTLCSDRLHAPRLTSWDVGAYEFGSQTSSKPNPPGNLNAIVQ
jgi:hypothetical protein